MQVVCNKCKSKILKNVRLTYTQSGNKHFIGKCDRCGIRAVPQKNIDLNDPSIPKVLSKKAYQAKIQLKLF